MLRRKPRLRASYRWLASSPIATRPLFCCLSTNHIYLLSIPRSDSVEVCHLWPLSQATLDEGDYLEVADLHQRPGFEGIVSSDGNATRFFVGVVLKDQTAKPLGVLCVLSAS